ncbi:hypothetical protein DXG01_002200 [Tephrocybe rancida]|nr:hypothetical protein DXG01_002200 [Tephrocybe rancida]
MRLFLASTAALALLKPHPVSAAALAGPLAVKEVTLNISNKQLAPDGFLRSTIVANGQYPGPAITAFKGQTLRVKVNNHLVRKLVKIKVPLLKKPQTDSSMRRSTTVSFDGIFQTAQSSFNEGSAFVTTCPIAPGASYTYEVDLGEQSGTFWYHSELSVQYVDGLRGALIVYDPKDPLRHLYDVDDLSTLIQLGDWWQSSTLPLLTAYEATGVVPVSDSGTVNGVGRYQGGPAVPFAVTNVVAGKRYRLRIINQSARNVFTVSVEGHALSKGIPPLVPLSFCAAVIEADGVATEAHTVDLIEMLAGQRYSVVLNANQPVANYWINAPFVGGSPARNLHQNATLSRSILRYKGAPIAEPTTAWTLGPENGVALVEANLRPLVSVTPPPADINISMDLTVVAGKAIWNVNNISYLPPKVPTLAHVLAGASTAADFDPTENTFVLPANKTVEIDFPATATDENEVNPIKRDVVAVGGTGTKIRLRTDTPGPWFFHCHIFWHKQAGLATVMLAAPDALRKEVKPTKAWQALCPA